MILRLAALLTQFRVPIVLGLAMPFLAVIGFSKIHFVIFAPPVAPEFFLNFRVPMRTAQEIFEKVVHPTETILNSLPQLTSLDSEIHHGTARTRIRFEPSVHLQSAFLNLQEKLDQIRLKIPKTVESMSLELVELKESPMIRIHAAEAMAPAEWQQLLSNIGVVVSHSDPDIQSGPAVHISLNLDEMRTLKIPISSVTQSLRTLSYTSILGTRDNLQFRSESHFKSIDDLKRVIVGAIGDRPVQLKDIADVTAVLPERSSTLNLWPEHLDSKLINNLQNHPAVNSIRLPQREDFVTCLRYIIALLIMILLGQYILVRGLKLPMRALIWIVLLGALALAHFVFWKNLLAPPIQLMDLHALMLSLVFGSICLGVYLIRVRFHLHLIPGAADKVKVEQAKLLTFAELAPTYLTLFAAMFLLSQPLMLSDINRPSATLIKSFFFGALPLVLTVLAIFAIIFPANYLAANLPDPKPYFRPRLSLNQLQFVFWALVLSAPLSIWALRSFPWQMKDHPTATHPLNEQLETIRGYGQNLLYFQAVDAAPNHSKLINAPDEAVKANWAEVKSSAWEEHEVWELDPNQLQLASHMDWLTFQQSLQDIQSHMNLGYIQIPESPKWQFQITSLPTGGMATQKLLVPQQSKNSEPLPVSQFFLKKWQGSWSQLNTSKLQLTYNFTPKAAASLFHKSDSPHIAPIGYTQYLLSQMDEYRSQLYVILIFLFMLFAIYFNSFSRSALILLFTVNFMGVLRLCQLFNPGGFHVDSWWLLSLGLFMALFQVIVTTRFVDIERQRGRSRTDSLRLIRLQLGPPLFFVSALFCWTLVVAGLLEFLPGATDLGLWREGIFIGIVTGLSLFIAARVLFPLFYMTGEDSLNQLAFILYRIWLRLKGILKLAP